MMNGDNMDLDAELNPPGDDAYVQEPAYNFVPPHVHQQQQQGPYQQQPGPQQWQGQQFAPWWPPYVQPEQRAPTPQPHRADLTSFWPHNPRVWFAQAESSFNTCFVVEERMKFDLVVKKLSEGTLDHVKSIVEAPELLERPYQAIKRRLLEVYQLDTWELVDRLLHFRELGDQKPSQLMDQMLASLPRGEVPGLIFKGMFLSRMPEDVRVHVQVAAEQLDCRQLAAACDARWLARTKKCGKISMVVPEPVEELADQVAALSVQPAKKGGAAGRGKDRGRGRGRGGGRGQPKGKLPGFTCWRHVQYGDTAFKCESPDLCSFQEQGN